MTTTQYLRAFARFWLLIVLCAVIGYFLPFVVSPKATTTYEATTTVVITTTAAVPPSTSDEYEAALLAHQRMATYAALADSSSFAEDVEDRVGSDVTATQVRKRVEVEVLPGAVALRVSAKDTDRERAELLAAQSAKAMVKLIAQYEAAKAQPTVLLKGRVAPGGDEPAVAAETTGGRKPFVTGAAGLLLGLALAVALARRDPELRDPHVVTELVDVPVLGVVPNGRTKRWPGRRSSATYDQGLDDVRTSIYFMREDVDGCLTVTFTSPLPVADQGRLSGDVAAALARTGARVLLVHADLHEQDDDAMQGLTAYLSGVNAAKGAVSHDTIPGVDVVPAGFAPNGAADLLHATAFDRLLTEAAERYDFVLVTAPATSGGTDAAAVAARCDATVLTLDSKVRERHLRESLRQLRNVDAKVRGLVLLS